MFAGLILLVAASQTFYQAKSDTFGCTSSDVVSRLEQIRPDEEAFQKELYQRIFHGECVHIAKRTLVEGSINEADAGMLTVDRDIQPPGYVAPLGDFEQSSVDEGRN